MLLARLRRIQLKFSVVPTGKSVFFSVTPIFTDVDVK